MKARLFCNILKEKVKIIFGKGMIVIVKRVSLMKSFIFVGCS